VRGRHDERGRRVEWWTDRGGKERSKLHTFIVPAPKSLDIGIGCGCSGCKRACWRRTWHAWKRGDWTALGGRFLGCRSLLSLAVHDCCLLRPCSCSWSMWAASLVVRTPRAAGLDRLACGFATPMISKAKGFCRVLVVYGGSTALCAPRSSHWSKADAAPRLAP